MMRAADGRSFYVQVEDEREQLVVLFFPVLPLNTE